jgi:hypothetical protein
VRNREEKRMKSVGTTINNSYPDFEQSWLMQEADQTITVPECGLIVTKGSDGLVRFHDDEFPALGMCIGIEKERVDE